MDHAKVVQGYLDGVMDGSIITGRLVKLAVRRYLDDLENAGERGFYFNEDLANEACTFFPTVLRHSIGEWASEPFNLTPIQAFTLWNIFGWRRTKDDLRRFRKVYVTVARKYGKTTFLSGVGLLMMAFDNPIEPGAEIYIAATKEDQAAIMFKEAVRMVQQSPDLDSIAEIVKKNIAIPSMNAFMRPLGSDSRTNAGWNPHAVLLDEVCDWREHQRGLWGALTTGSGSRRQPLRIVTCTAGDEDSDIWYEEDQYATLVVESINTGVIIDDEYFAIIARLDEERMHEECDGKGCDVCGDGILPADDPFDESVWEKANPNLGVTPKLDYLKGQATEAKNKPAAMHDFLRFHCNLQVSSAVKTIDMDLWAKGARDFEDWSMHSCYGAFDLGWASDLASIALVARFYEDEDDEGNARWRYEARQWSFVPEGTATDLTREPWAGFIEGGHLIVTPGETTDINGAFKAKIMEVTEDFDCIQWAYDPHQARGLASELDTEGMEAFKFSQNHAMYNEPMLLFSKIISDGLFVHAGDPLLTWCAKHLRANKDHRNAMMPSKKASRSKIDPVVATIMALGGAMSGPEEQYWNPETGVSM